MIHAHVEVEKNSKNVTGLKMELTCPKCNQRQVVSDDEIFPGCRCGYVFETMPVLDRVLPEVASPEMQRSKRKKNNRANEIIISSEAGLNIAKSLGIVIARRVIPEDVVVTELTKECKREKPIRYRNVVTELISELKEEASALSADALINLRLEHAVLPAALGGPAIMVFANALAVVLKNKDQ